MPGELRCNTIGLFSGTTVANPEEVQNQLFLWSVVKPEIGHTYSLIFIVSPAPAVTQLGTERGGGRMVTDIHILNAYEISFSEQSALELLICVIAH